MYGESSISFFFGGGGGGGGLDGGERHTQYRKWQINKQLENVEYFNYLGSQTTNDVRGTMGY
jgi:hypothetical protein